MNRPFSAFGALAALASLAMFAVSSTTRSTSLRPQMAASRLSIQTRLRGGNYVLVLPAATSERDDAIVDNCSDDGAGMSPPANEPLAHCTLPSSLRSVRVEAARDSVRAWRMPSEIDCRAGYDVDYDRIIYGAAATETPVMRSVVAEPGLSRERLEGDLTGLFQSFLSSEQQAEPTPRAGSGRIDVARLRTLAIVMGKWLRGQVERIVDEIGLRTKLAVGGSPGPMKWDEYAELIDGAARQRNATEGVPYSATTALPVATSDTGKGVRYGGWLRHSAALRLHQLGSLLQTAALELEWEAADSRSAAFEGIDQ